MSGRVEPEGGFDHLAKAEGQTVHCNRAAFFALGGIPLETSKRLRLGFELGAGMVFGGAAAVGLIVAGNKILAAIFAALVA